MKRLLCCSRTSTSAIAALFVLLALTSSVRAADPPKAGNQYALLIGCTKYDNGDIPELWGPSQDAPAWAKLLTDDFGFPAANLVQLVGTPDDPAKKPTRANIVKGFEGLIAKAAPGDRVFILMSGHGTQIPIPEGQDPLDPNNYEPDGLDEVFLPADVKLSEKGLQNHIIDDEIGAWLDKIRDKGADVLIVFDCCHSGTMTRGLGDVERARLVRPQVLGILDKDIAAAVQRGKDAMAKAVKEGRNPEAEMAKIRPAKNPKGKGSLVAFYAAQPFETAPELPLPEGVAQIQENYYGMLSFTLIQALRERQNPVTYRELTQVMTARYRASRGTRGPLPFAEGDLDREVLGLKEWPNRGRVVLMVEPKKPLQLSVGQLAGVTPESILAVYPPAIDAKKRDPKVAIGYVRVKTATVYNAEVVPCEFEKKPAVAETELENLCRCEIVARDYGDMRVKLFIGTNPVVKAAFAKMNVEVREMMRLVESEAQADWILKVVTPAEAKEYGLKEGLTGDHALLVRSEGHAADNAEAKKEAKAYADHLARLGKPPSRRAFGAYPLDKPDGLVSSLERDLPKVFKWQNVLKVSGGVAADKGGDALGLKVEVAVLKNKDDKVGEVLRGANIIPKNAVLDFRVDNTAGKENLWVVALWLDAELQIQVYDVIQVAAFKSAKLAPADVDLPAGAYGAESLVIFAIPQSVLRDKPDFDFLQQSSLRVAEGLSRSERKKNIGDSPFAQLMGRATLSGGNTRGGAKIVNTTPAVIVQSWFVAP